MHERVAVAGAGQRIRILVNIVIAERMQKYKLMFIFEINSRSSPYLFAVVDGGQTGEINQNFGHLITTFATADINDTLTV